jgi:Leucine-rich repeat (LRR) protein
MHTNPMVALLGLAILNRFSFLTVRMLAGVPHAFIQSLCFYPKPIFWPLQLYYEMGILLVSLTLTLLLLLGNRARVSPFTLADLQIDDLAGVTSINVTYNGPGNLRLFGPIPIELGTLTNLKVLLLAKHSLSGAIPPELGNLTSLTELELSNDSLSGTIPAELGRLAALTKLKLSKNNNGAHSSGVR